MWSRLRYTPGPYWTMVGNHDLILTHTGVVTHTETRPRARGRPAGPRLALFPPVFAARRCVVYVRVAFHYISPPHYIKSSDGGGWPAVHRPPGVCS
jgi:hypothetical protein